MSNTERRRSPRKECLVPVRFRILDGGNSRAGSSVRLTDSGAGPGTHAHFGMADGQAENLSERGVYVVSAEKLTTGEELELFLTLPSELTGRSAEGVRCYGRVIYAQPLERKPGFTGAGVLVRSFETVSRIRNWAN